MKKDLHSHPRWSLERQLPDKYRRKPLPDRPGYKLWSPRVWHSHEYLIWRFFGWLLSGLQWNIPFSKRLGRTAWPVEPVSVTGAFEFVWGRLFGAGERMFGKVFVTISKTYLPHLIQTGPKVKTEMKKNAIPNGAFLNARKTLKPGKGN